MRTHPVHPELVSGTFICLDCQTVIKDVEQQFKYTQVFAGCFCFFTKIGSKFFVINFIASF